jgi:hypothetical protein
LRASSCPSAGAGEEIDLLIREPWLVVLQHAVPVEILVSGPADLTGERGRGG